MAQNPWCQQVSGQELCGAARPSEERLRRSRPVGESLLHGGAVESSPRKQTERQDMSRFVGGQYPRVPLSFSAETHRKDCLRASRLDGQRDRRPGDNRDEALIA